jgi:hypothetical protein
MIESGIPCRGEVLNTICLKLGDGEKCDRAGNHLKEKDFWVKYGMPTPFVQYMVATVSGDEELNKQFHEVLGSFSEN